MGLAHAETPLLPGETLMSWVARMGREQTGLEPPAFLSFIGLSRTEVIEATPACLTRLADLTAMPRAQIERSAYSALDLRFYAYRGQQFSAEFAGRARTTFCPACLLDDARLDSLSRGRRVGRTNWLFSPVRTCGVHRITLVRSINASVSGQFQDMDVVAPSDAELAALAATAIRREVSPLQAYVEARLEGVPGPDWLDGQQIDQAARATEMLGACLLHGVRVAALTEDQKDAAGAKGFRFTSRGEDGLNEAFEGMLKQFREREGKGGPQAIYGSLYVWLQFQKSGRSRGPIREALRKFILDRMAIAPGARLLGETLKVRRRHTVASLARQAKLNPKTLNRALVLSSLLPEGEADRVDGNLSVDAQAGERLAERLQKSTSVKKIPEYLKCNRMQAEQLVRHGFVNRIGGKDATAETMSNMVPTEELDGFLVRFRAHGLPAKGRSEGMRSVVDAARIARRPVHEIVRLVVHGSLARIELLDEKFGFESVLIDPEEVGKALDAREARGRLSIREASTRLNLANSGVRALAKNIGRDGQPLIRASIECDQMTTRKYWFDPKDIEMFAADHVDLAGLAKERGATINTLRKQLKTEGIEPILPKGALEKLLYRRSDL